MTIDSDRRTGLRTEVALVLLLSLGQSAVYAIVSLTARLTADQPLGEQTVTMNDSRSDRPWLDLTIQLFRIAFALVPALLAVYLLRGHPLGLRPSFGYDATRGVALAAVIGIPGLGLVFVAGQLGLNANLVPAALPDLWWAVPVLVLSALQNAILEEVVVVGYLVTRLRDMAWRIPTIIVASSVLRGSYHLYQGFGAFVGNAVMGVLFALFYLRTKRVMPLIVAHALLDICAFVGYTLLPKSWLTWT